MGRAFDDLVRAEYRYGLTMEEIGRDMMKEDIGWMHRALKALIRTRTNLHETGRKKLYLLQQWYSLKEMVQRKEGSLVWRLRTLAGWGDEKANLARASCTRHAIYQEVRHLT